MTDDTFYDNVHTTVFGRPFGKRFALYWTVVCSVLFVLSICDVDVLWPKGWDGSGCHLTWV